jgi:hypothetical protein
VSSTQRAASDFIALQLRRNEIRDPNPLGSTGMSAVLIPGLTAWVLPHRKRGR